MSTDHDLASLLPTRAHTFALATSLLPRGPREAVTVLYAFCRTVDDLVDEPVSGATRDETIAALAAWRRWLLLGLPPRALPEPASLAEALRAVVLGHDVPARYLLGLVDGVASDLEPARVPNFAALRRYAVQVAGTVGLAMCHVLGARDPITLAAAVELGIAMQLTNILRDVGGDLRAGRIYVPLDELAAFGYTPERFLDLAEQPDAADAAFGALMRHQIGRARAYYARGIVGVWRLPWRTRASILLAARLYRAILDEIEPCVQAVLTGRVATTRARKLREAAICTAVALFHPGAAATPGPRPQTLQEALAWLEP
jgi:15-cis-phytoene synthase